MREILFRAKNYKGKWLYGSLQQWYDEFGGEIKSQINTIELESEQQGGRVKSITVGQFTGLTDKNGTKIFEGDVLSVSSPLRKRGEEPRKQLVEWKDYKWVGINEYAIAEVIGNIHDNPELLEAK